MNIFSESSNFSEFFNFLKQLDIEGITDVRHELFFQIQNKPSVAFFKAILALLRDAVHIILLPKKKITTADVLFISTLNGQSGWQSLAPLENYFKSNGLSTNTIIHPRLQKKVSGTVPSRPTIFQLIRNVKLTANIPANASYISKIVIHCCIIRHQLWKSVFEHLFSESTQSILFLHNDFDMISRAACKAYENNCALDKPPIFCVQHGLPTDEFFPTAATFQVVWNKKLKEIYRRMGHNLDDIIVFNPNQYKKIHKLPHETRDKVIYVASQTHTNIYGLNLKELFISWINSIAEKLPNVKIIILLHPEEIRNGHPYSEYNDNVTLSSPPHPLIMKSKHAKVVLGYSSTILSELAFKGHLVFGMHAIPLQSQLAYEVSKPVICLSNNDKGLETILQSLENTLEFDKNITIQSAHLIEQSDSDDTSDMLNFLKENGLSK